MKVIVPNTEIETCNSPEIDKLSANQTCIIHDNLTRCWYTYIPESVIENDLEVPIVLDLHGWSYCAYSNTEYTGWNDVAKKEGFIVIYPQGNIDSSVTNQTCWNAGGCCCTTHGVMDPLGQLANIDDSGFLRQAISNTISTTRESMNITIDKKRMYFAGHSNGCMMDQAMAAQHSDIVAAVCCHSGILVTDADDSIASNYHPTPIQTVFGDLDLVVPYDITTSFSRTLPIQNAVENFEFWGKVNNCTEKSATIDDDNIYKKHTYSQCTDNATIQMLQIFGAGHVPYKGHNLSSVEIALRIASTTVDTAKLSWDFCSNYQLDVDPTFPDPVPYVSPYTTFVGDIDNATNSNIASQPTTMTNDGWNLSTNILPGVLLFMYFIVRS